MDKIEAIIHITNLAKAVDDLLVAANKSERFPLKFDPSVEVKALIVSIQLGILRDAGLKLETLIAEDGVE